MTVGEMIEKLSGIDPSTSVYVVGYEDVNGSKCDPHEPGGVLVAMSLRGGPEHESLIIGPKPVTDAMFKDRCGTLVGP